MIEKCENCGKKQFSEEKHDLGKKHFEFQVLKETKFTSEFLS